jgi:hypothetical protein
MKLMRSVFEKRSKSGFDRWIAPDGGAAEKASGSR